MNLPLPRRKGSEWTVEASSCRKHQTQPSGSSWPGAPSGAFWFQDVQQVLERVKPMWMVGMKDSHHWIKKQLVGEKDSHLLQWQLCPWRPLYRCKKPRLLQAEYFPTFCSHPLRSPFDVSPQFLSNMQKLFWVGECRNFVWAWQSFLAWLELNLLYRFWYSIGTAAEANLCSCQLRRSQFLWNSEQLQALFSVTDTICGQNVEN